MAKVNIGLGQANANAADIIRRRMLAHSETMKTLLPKVKARAVAVAGVEDMAVLNRVRRECAKVPEGRDWKEARKKIAALIGDKGAMKNRAELVLRTNCETARATAHWQNIRKEADIFPYLMYETMRDGQVRPSHKALDGMIVKAGDDFWKTHYPPWDWGCRCTVIQIDEETKKQLCADGMGKEMSARAMQDFEAKFGNEKHTFEFDPEGFGDFTKLNLDKASLRDMHDALSRDIPGNTVRNERNEPENAWEFLWRTGPQAADNETLRKLAEDLNEHAVIRDAATGEILDTVTGTPTEVDDPHGWYRRGIGGKVRTTHIHVNGNPLPSPTDIKAALDFRSEKETVITAADEYGVVGLPDAKNRRNQIGRELDEIEEKMSTYAMSADDWKEWLGTHTDIVRFIEPKEEQQ